MMDKGFRNYLKRKYYIRRLKRNSYWLGHSFIERSKSWKDMYDNRDCTKLMTCATTCSCWMCSKYYKYDRKKYRRETKRILKEWMEE